MLNFKAVSFFNFARVHIYVSAYERERWEMDLKRKACDAQEMQEGVKGWNVRFEVDTLEREQF